MSSIRLLSLRKRSKAVVFTTNPLGTENLFLINLPKFAALLPTPLSLLVISVKSIVKDSSLVIKYTYFYKQNFTNLII
ncbi:hypothetical protein ES703_107906 [subsurface metagenome]